VKEAPILDWNQWMTLKWQILDLKTRTRKSVQFGSAKYAIQAYISTEYEWNTVLLAEDYHNRDGSTELSYYVRQLSGNGNSH
jgi:hypothetical protein